MNERLPALFLGHGSPMTMITDNPERRALEALGQGLPRPQAILCVTAHWETHERTHLTASDAPATIHDFRGFPPELYAMRYPAPGSPELARRAAALLGDEQAALDDRYGFDHGAWGVLLPMFPDTDVPTVAVSLDRALTPGEHLALGRRLAPLRDEGVLLVASGNVVHNLASWRQSAGTEPAWAVDFQRRVNMAMLDGNDEALARFDPGDEAAAMAVNSGEHYLPLLYAAGARLPGDEVAVFNDRIDGALSMTSFLVGDPTLLAGLA